MYLPTSPRDPRAASSGETQASSYHPPPQLRSCQICRHRKVKCDRQKPCSNCSRAGLSCVYPPGRGRAPKKPRHIVDGRLGDRLARLESTIRHLQEQSHIEGPKDNSPSDPKPNASINHNLERLMVAESKSYYIEELRDMLHESSSEDEENVSIDPANSPQSSAAPLGSNASILGYRSLAQSLRSFHPTLQQSVALFNTFSENVARIVYIFHMPTTTQTYWNAVANLDALDKDTEALLFSMYYSASISLDSAQCEAMLGTSRDAALEKYRFATEQAMARANLLNTQSIVLLQAAVVFLTALRDEDGSRTVWSLSALVFHLARAMGLHRDGTAFGLRPLETELRRRLWHHICFLDLRSSDYHGYEPIVSVGGARFDTRRPLNINDSDITPAMTVPPPERDGPTDLAFTIVRCEVMTVVAALAQPSLSQAERTALLTDLETRLETEYLRHFDTTDPLQLLAATIAQLALNRHRFTLHFPSRGEVAQEPGAQQYEATRDRLLATSTEILELSGRVLTTPCLAGWAWHSRTHIQWQTVVLALSEICRRPPGPEVERAWNAVNVMYKEWPHALLHATRGSLWRPIQRLMAKARYVRAVQAGETPPTEAEGSTIASAGERADAVPGAAAEVPLADHAMGDVPPVPVPVMGGLADGVPSLEHMDGFLDMFTDSMDAELFWTMFTPQGSSPQENWGASGGDGSLDSRGFFPQ
ncbi:Zn(II)2Cys6 transcription factor [Xylariomycetidae sp. FL0641]|nr:Zn(II)2Cys6 transcription factor [Xylariomycetidae sp. FL0641]